MRRAVAILLVAVLFVACGDSGGGGGGGGAVEVPGLALVWFGGSADPAGCGIIGKVDSVKQGAPVFAGAHLFPAHDPKDLSAAISARGNVLKSVSLTPCTGGAADSAIADLSGAGLGPGTYIVSFRDPKGTTYAAGNLTINP